MMMLKNLWEKFKTWLEKKLEYILNTRVLAILLIIIIYLAPALLRIPTDSLKSRLKNNLTTSIEQIADEDELKQPEAVSGYK